MNDELLSLLDFDAPENRTAFIAALIMERCKKIPEGGGFLVPRFNPYQAERIATRLASLAGRIHRYAEIDCNRGLSANEEKRCDSLSEDFKNIARLIGFEGRTGGDPRGACAYLVDPANPKDGDGWGNGWAVYK